MQKIFGLVKDIAEKLLAEGTVNRIIGWKKGEFVYDPTPAVFNAECGLDGFVYNSFCASNLSKYLVGESKKDGKILALLKPCDTYGFNQLVKEHRVEREKIFALGVECRGMLDINKIKALDIKGVKRVKENGQKILIHTVYGEKSCSKSEVLLEKCICCKGKQHMAYDELAVTGDKFETESANRFELVEKLESMDPGGRFEFWQGELSKCIRCNACRNACPACTCIKCVFDNDSSGIASKASTDSFEENMFHIIRAFHVTGRCTDCGECSRACPQGIPLHLLNRKLIKDINEFYGQYQAGAASAPIAAPLTSFTKEDVEPDIVTDKGGDQ